jgi:hypothetical protein
MPTDDFSFVAWSDFYQAFVEDPAGVVADRYGLCQTFYLRFLAALLFQTSTLRGGPSSIQWPHEEATRFDVSSQWFIFYEELVHAYLTGYLPAWHASLWSTTLSAPNRSVYVWDPETHSPQKTQLSLLPPSPGTQGQTSVLQEIPLLPTEPTAYSNPTDSKGQMDLGDLGDPGEPLPGLDVNLDFEFRHHQASEKFTTRAVLDGLLARGVEWASTLPGVLRLFLEQPVELPFTITSATRFLREFQLAVIATQTSLRPQEFPLVLPRILFHALVTEVNLDARSVAPPRERHLLKLWHELLRPTHRLRLVPGTDRRYATWRFATLHWILQSLRFLRSETQLPDLKRKQQETKASNKQNKKKKKRNKKQKKKQSQPKEQTVKTSTVSSPQSEPTQAPDTRVDSLLDQLQQWEKIKQVLVTATNAELTTAALVDVVSWVRNGLSSFPLELRPAVRQLALAVESVVLASPRPWLDALDALERAAAAALVVAGPLRYGAFSLPVTTPLQLGLPLVQAVAQQDPRLSTWRAGLAVVQRTRRSSRRRPPLASTSARSFQPEAKAVVQLLFVVFPETSPSPPLNLPKADRLWLVGQLQQRRGRTAEDRQQDNLFLQERQRFSSSRVPQTFAARIHEAQPQIYSFHPTPATVEDAVLKLTPPTRLGENGATKVLPGPVPWVPLVPSVLPTEPTRRLLLWLPPRPCAFGWIFCTTTEDRAWLTVLGDLHFFQSSPEHQTETILYLRGLGA